MKNTILALLMLVCVGLGILGAEQERKLHRQSDELAQTKQQLAALEAEMKEKSETVENAKLSETKAKILQQTLNESTTAVVEQSKKAEKLQESLSEAKTNNPMHNMAAMFKDPKMREMMKSQQKMFIGPVIDKQYGDLFKQLNLTQDQVAGVKDLIQKKMLAGSDVGFSMMDDSLDASQRADLAKQVKTQTDDYDSQIKQFLGDDSYQSYQSYEKSIPDRMTVAQFGDQFAGTATALNNGQQQQLIQAMSDARNNFKWTSGLNQQNPGMNGDMGSLLTPDNIEKFAQEREQFDNDFLNKAQQILSPEQFAAFKEFQATQRNLQITGLKMAGQMIPK
jgi:hypothetical protein